MDLSKFENNDGVYNINEMVEAEMEPSSKGHIIVRNMLNWIEYRLGTTVYDEFEF